MHGLGAGGIVIQNDDLAPRGVNPVLDLAQQQLGADTENLSRHRRRVVRG